MNILHEILADIDLLIYLRLENATPFCNLQILIVALENAVLI